MNHNVNTVLTIDARRSSSLPSNPSWYSMLCLSSPISSALGRAEDTREGESFFSLSFTSTIHCFRYRSCFMVYYSKECMGFIILSVLQRSSCLHIDEVSFILSNAGFPFHRMEVLLRSFSYKRDILIMKFQSCTREC